MISCAHNVSQESKYNAETLDNLWPAAGADGSGRRQRQTDAGVTEFKVQAIQDLLACSVERAGRLVEHLHRFTASLYSGSRSSWLCPDQNLGFCHEGSRQGYSLPLTPRKIQTVQRCVVSQGQPARQSLWLSGSLALWGGQTMPYMRFCPCQVCARADEVVHTRALRSHLSAISIAW